MIIDIIILNCILYIILRYVLHKYNVIRKDDKLVQVVLAIPPVSIIVVLATIIVTIVLLLKFKK